MFLIVYCPVRCLSNRNELAIPALGHADAVFAVLFAMPAGFPVHFCAAGGVSRAVLAKYGLDLCLSVRSCPDSAWMGQKFSFPIGKSSFDIVRNSKQMPSFNL